VSHFELAYAFVQSLGGVNAFWLDLNQ